MAEKPNLTIEQLRQLLDYDPETGVLVWRARPLDMFAASGLGGKLGASARWHGRCFGKAAGSIRKDGYVFLEIRSCGESLGRFSAHQIAFAFIHNRWAQGDIDHIDGNPTNNRADNLRDVSRSINMQNARPNRRNKSGKSGVYRRPTGLWCANIRVNNKTIYLGSSFDFAEAVSLREAAEKKYGFSERHGK